MKRGAVQHDEAIFDALGNPVRREIVRYLSDRAHSVGELADRLPISRPAVSKHLRLLEDAQLVAHVSVGNRNVFQLHPDGFEHARRWLEGFWKQALYRFALVAENTEEGSR